MKPMSDFLSQKRVLTKNVNVGPIKSDFFYMFAVDIVPRKLWVQRVNGNPDGQRANEEIFVRSNAACVQVARRREDGRTGWFESREDPRRKIRDSLPVNAVLPDQTDG